MDGTEVVPPDETGGCEYVGVEIGILRSLSLFPSRVEPPVRGLFPSPVAGEVDVVTDVPGGTPHGLTGL